MDDFRHAVDAVIHQNVVSEGSMRIATMTTDARAILRAPDEFLASSTQKIVSLVRSCVFRTKQQEEAFVTFNIARFAAIQKEWEQLYHLLSLNFDDQILSQSVNQKLFDDSLARKFMSMSEQPSPSASPRELTTEEKNILRMPPVQSHSISLGSMPGYVLVKNNSEFTFPSHFINYGRESRIAPSQ